MSVAHENNHISTNASKFIQTEENRPSQPPTPEDYYPYPAPPSTSSDPPSSLDHSHDPKDPSLLTSDEENFVKLFIGQVSLPNFLHHLIFIFTLDSKEFRRRGTSSVFRRIWTSC